MLDLIRTDVFYEVAALLALAAATGFVGHLLRQPLIVAFIVVGILAGPAGLDIARAHASIDLLGELGIALLLFLVGLKLDLQLVRTLGAVALTTGLGQVAFTTAFGYLLALALGLDAVAALYVAVALTFSSTIIIVKLLSDKREIDALHGRIALGFLIVQDFVVVLAMIVLSSLAAGTGEGSAAQGVLQVAVAGGATVLFVGVFVRWLADPLLERLARAPELLVAFAMGWAALLAATGDHLGFGKELGGLLAGISFASTPYREAIAARLAPLRDFLLLFFFLALGAGLQFAALGEQLVASIVLALFVLIGNPLIVLAIMGVLGYRKRTGFLAGLTVAQISEFSLIFIAMGVSLGHVDDSALALVTLVGLITIAASTYMITWSHTLYRWLEPFLGVFERRVPRREPGLEAAPPPRDADVLVFGLGRYGTALARALTEQGRRVLGVDFDPVALAHARSLGLDARFGDASDPEFLGHLPTKGLAWAVCTLPAHGPGPTHDDPSEVLLRSLREQGFEGRIAVTAHGEHAAARVEALGADLVLLPFRDAALEAADLLREDRRPPATPLPDPTGQKELYA
jgi:Kef-type K+ transport system membrane component KefB